MYTCKLKSTIYSFNFGYTQVLFMGSVPRINHLLEIVPIFLKGN